jgi:putative PIN family toxin of toxin-antitoxin system
MRLVVDTNVFVSAALKDKSLPAMALRVIEQRGRLLKSVASEQQLLDVLTRPYLASLIATASSNWLANLLAAAELITIIEHVTDDKFLELALSGKADVIVTGDADLLVLDPFRGIPIISPATFVQTVML